MSMNRENVYKEIIKKYRMFKHKGIYEIITNTLDWDKILGKGEKEKDWKGFPEYKMNFI